ncbi:hypothetical protein AB0G79_15275 [Streptomyces sp. NPDC020807]|uniref:hypothetical protein n=1 Tax=Streptomyces sp. NPDC020807 TaxID=3155119 RepID=UPI0033FD226A
MPSAHTLLGLTAPSHHDATDLVVDGRPLLHRLDEAEGIDAVPPLAADLPPVLRADHVRALLTAPRTAVRRTLYSCPDCADGDALGCGTVSVVVERDGEDVVWRDFAWQTEATSGRDRGVDPVRDGYPGVGPYRFRADAYRSALLGLPGVGTPLVGAAV